MLEKLSEQSTRKCYFDGTHRARTPEHTFALISPLFRRFGITRVANVTGLDHIGIATAIAVRPNARSMSVALGKGSDLVAARTSAAMEAIEHFHAEHVELPTTVESFDELSRRARVIDVARLPRYFVPFSASERIAWVQATELRTGETLHVPHGMVHLDLRLPLPAGSGYFPLNSSGLASGNDLGEAIAHGLLELVERDALACFYRRSSRAQDALRVEANSVGSEHCQRLLQLLRAAGLRVTIWDITSDVGIAAFLCTVLEQSFDSFRTVGKASGFGCHVDRDVALSRALTEAAQSRLARIAGSRDDLVSEELDALKSEARVSQQLHELEQYTTPERSFAAIPSQRHDSIADDLVWILDRLRAIGCDQVSFVDLSRPDLPISVARVLVPGLEGHPDAPGYVPGARAKAVSEGL